MRPLFLSLTFALAAMPALAQSQAAPVDWTAAQTVEVDLKNFAFSPANITLKQGQPYRLRLVNQASGAHDFTAKAFFSTAATIDPDDRAAVLDGGRIELKGGQTVEIRLVANQAGQFDVSCTHFMHASMGMQGRLVVQ